MRSALTLTSGGLYTATMMRTPQILLAVLFLLAGAMLVQAERPVGPASGQMLVLLDNGEVFAGEVVYQGADVEVRLANGGVLWLPRLRVSCVAPNWEDLYSYHSALASQERIDDQLAEVRWCMRQQLYPEAEYHLAIAKQLVPRHREVESLQRQLTQRQQVQATAPAFGQQASDTEENQSGMSLVEQATYVEEVPAFAAQGRTDSPPVFTGPTVEQLRAELGMSLVVDFNQAVQPVLLNSCATNACHGSAGGSDWHLVPPLDGRLPTQRISERNLNQVLKLLQPSEPASGSHEDTRENRETAAPLTANRLLAGIEPHGEGAYGTYGGLRGTPHQIVTAWVNQVVTNSSFSTSGSGRVAPSATPASHVETPRAFPSPSTEPEPLWSEGEVPREFADEPAAEPLRPELSDDSLPFREGSNTPSAPAHDPHDPASFNQQYHPDRGEAVEEAPGAVERSSP